MQEIKNKDIPYINIFDSEFNPILSSPNDIETLPFYKTKEYFYDVEAYRAFIKNCISRFRNSITYKHYKDYLYNDIGLDRCQIHSNITKDMATLEMHHTIITIFDIAVIICEHMLNTVGYISSFDLVQLLKEEHKSNNIPLVMITKTPHQLYHNANLDIPISLIFGNWMLFLERYNRGITLDIAYKILYYIKDHIDNKIKHSELLNIRDKILSWANYNERSQFNGNF